MALTKAVSDLPALSSVATRILEATSRENCSAAEIERLLNTDQAIAAKTLRIVNSAYYGMSGQVSSLSQAAVILGMQQIRSLVLSLAASGLLVPAAGDRRRAQNNIWLHAFGTAAASDMVARRKRMEPEDVELAFLGGLLHDIGTLFMFGHFYDVFQAIENRAHESGATLDDAALELTGLTTSAIGKELGKKWLLPERLVAVIGPNLGPFDTPEPLPALYAIHIGDRIAEQALTGEEMMRDPNPRVLDWLTLSEDDLAKIANRTRDKLGLATDFFGLMAA